MKKIILISFACLLAIVGCKKDPWNVVEKGEWNNDRMILDIKFVGQAGTAEIDNTDENTGVISLQLASNTVEDMSAVAVESLTVSYKATSSLSVGETVDFTAAEAPQIVVTSQTGKSRTYTIEMTEFTETIVGCYALTGTKLWCGTGSVYGGAAVMSPEEKSWCWDGNGYGPQAEYDDYLEFILTEITAEGNTTGQCIHYGGEDAKHWNCIFAAKQNPETGVALDLHHFYRQIPIGTSTWIRNYTDNTLTFIDSKGNETVGEFLPAGNYDYVVNREDTGAQETHRVTVDNNAFRFALSGTQDWDNIYSDYDKFAKHPMAYYIMVQKVDAIPEASKTEGSEGDISIDEPEEPSEFVLAGSYSLSRFTVYGGSDSPAFVNPVDKNWCFNNAEAESDNVLTLTAGAEGDASGTANYGAGADGQYWDYVFKADHNSAGTGALYLTRYYGMLPHGESEYTYDAEASTISFKSGAITVTMTLLQPGDYTYGSSSLTVPAGSIGIDFPCGGQPGPSEYYYQDYDRFAVCPINYVMIFSKNVSE